MVLAVTILKKGWWDIEPQDFDDQVKRYCKDCSGALPLKQDSDGLGGRLGPAYDTISKKFGKIRKG